MINHMVAVFGDLALWAGMCADESIHCPYNKFARDVHKKSYNLAYSNGPT
jgi:hypothetical protein